MTYHGTAKGQCGIKPSHHLFGALRPGLTAQPAQKVPVHLISAGHLVLTVVDLLHQALLSHHSASQVRVLAKVPEKHAALIQEEVSTCALS